MTDITTFFICVECTWAGEADELVDDDETGKYDQCPRCGGRGFINDEEEVDD